jgi:hypothetical protein
MAMIGHKTESIYQRYSIVDQAMLEMGTAKLEALQQIQRASRPESVVSSMKKRTRESPRRDQPARLYVMAQSAVALSGSGSSGRDPGVGAERSGPGAQFLIARRL